MDQQMCVCGRGQQGGWMREGGCLAWPDLTWPRLHHHQPFPPLPRRRPVFIPSCLADDSSRLHSLSHCWPLTSPGVPTSWEFTGITDRHKAGYMRVGWANPGIYLFYYFVFPLFSPVTFKGVPALQFSGYRLVATWESETERRHAFVYFLFVCVFVLLFGNTVWKDGCWKKRTRTIFHYYASF